MSEKDDMYLAVALDDGRALGRISRSELAEMMRSYVDAFGAGLQDDVVPRMDFHGVACQYVKAWG